MTKIKKPKLDKVQVTAEEAMQDWRQAVITAQPIANADFVRTVCQSILKMAHKMASENNLNFPEVAAFYLMTTRQWCIGGFPVAGVLNRLPTTLHDLGLMKIEADKDAVDVFVKQTKRPN